MHNDNEPPAYSEIDPLSAAGPPSPCPKAYPHIKPPSHPDLADPRDNLFRVLQVDRLDDSTAKVFDKALQLNFADMQRHFALGTRTTHRPLVYAGGHHGELHSEVCVAPDGHHLLHTRLRVRASSEEKLWWWTRWYRCTETAPQPCPHMDRTRLPQPALFCPAREDFESFKSQLHDVCAMEARKQAHGTRRSGVRAECQICATLCVVCASGFGSGGFSLDLHTYHDFGLLDSPAESAWVRTAAVLDSALVRPWPAPAESSAVEKRYFAPFGKELEEADRRLATSKLAG